MQCRPFSAFEVSADLWIYAELENNKPRELLAKLAGARDRKYHLRGRKPWGLEETEASEYVSLAKPISK